MTEASRSPSVTYVLDESASDGEAYSGFFRKSVESLSRNGGIPGAAVTVLHFGGGEWIKPFVEGVGLGCRVIENPCDKGYLESLRECRYRSHVPGASLAKFWIPSIVDSRRTLYLDCDTLVTGDLSDLFGLGFGDCLAMACEDRGIFRRGMGSMDRGGRYGMIARNGFYFNSGVMVLNLSAMREEGTGNSLTARKADQSRPTEYVDQDVFNEIIGGRTLPLPAQYNMTPEDMGIGSVGSIGAEDALRTAIGNGLRIAHFAGAPDKKSAGYSEFHADRAESRISDEGAGSGLTAVAVSGDREWLSRISVQMGSQKPATGRFRLFILDNGSGEPFSIDDVPERIRGASSVSRLETRAPMGEARNIALREAAEALAESGNTLSREFSWILPEGCAMAGDDSVARVMSALGPEVRSLSLCSPGFMPSRNRINCMDSLSGMLVTSLGHTPLFPERDGCIDVAWTVRAAGASGAAGMKALWMSEPGRAYSSPISIPDMAPVAFAEKVAEMTRASGVPFWKMLAYMGHGGKKELSDIISMGDNFSDLASASEIGPDGITEGMAELCRIYADLCSERSSPSCSGMSDSEPEWTRWMLRLRTDLS